MKYAPARIALKKSLPRKVRVSGFRATWTLTMSARRATSNRSSTRSTPNSAARSGVRRRLQATTGMPEACARYKLRARDRVEDASRLVVVRQPFVTHADFLHHAARGRVLRNGDGDDAREVRLLEAVAQAGGGRLGRVALSPEGAGEAVADLCLARIFKRLQT